MVLVLQTQSPGFGSHKDHKDLEMPTAFILQAFNICRDLVGFGAGGQWHVQSEQWSYSKI